MRHINNFRQHLSEEANKATVQWEKPCDNMFARLADQYPQDLYNLCKNGNLYPSELTFAEEYLGQCIMSKDSPLIEDIYLHLTNALSHNPSSIVREGALLGLDHMTHEGHISGHRLLSILNEVINTDSSPGVRHVADNIRRYLNTV